MVNVLANYIAQMQNWYMHGQKKNKDVYEGAIKLNLEPTAHALLRKVIDVTLY